MKHKLTLTIVVGLLFTTNLIQAQSLQVTDMTQIPGWTADSLVRNVFLGQGIDIMNVMFNGNDTISCNGIGTFSTNGQTNLGLTSGLVLSASSLEYLNTTGSNSFYSSCSDYSDNALTNISSYLHNVALLEFDLIPHSDSISFNYIFASEEYYGYECTPYNDLVAFLLDGPNPQGGLYTNYNIALVPGTNVPVSVSTINGGVSYGNSTPCITSNSQYFVNNQAQSHLKHLDGFTTVLKACAKVIPCQTYHIKLAVANIGDMVLPSCVFMESNSLSSNSINISTTTPPAIYEGDSITINIDMSNPYPNAVLIHPEFSGSATFGADFSGIDSVIVFPDNSTHISHTFNTIVDSIDETAEYLKIVFRQDNGCTAYGSIEIIILDTIEARIDTVIVTIHDTLTVQPTLHTLTVSSSDISKGLAAGSGYFPEGTVVEIAAIPLEGFRFSSWDDGEISNPRSVTLAGDMSYIASFETLGIDEASMTAPWTLRSERGTIIVEGVSGQTVRIYDIEGRLLKTVLMAPEQLRYNVPASGNYIVQSNDKTAKKIVVLK